MQARISVALGLALTALRRVRSDANEVERTDNPNPYERVVTWIGPTFAAETLVYFSFPSSV